MKIKEICEWIYAGVGDEYLKEDELLRIIEECLYHIKGIRR